MATALEASTRSRARHVARSTPQRLPQAAALGVVCLGAAMALVGAWAALAPYVGPRIGFTSDGAAAWQWSSTRTALSLVPGATAFLCGLAAASLAGRLAEGARRGLLLLAGALAAMAGAWLVLGPFAWPVLTSHATPYLAGTARHRLLIESGASLGPGLALVLLGGLALGLAAWGRPEPAGPSATGPESQGWAEPERARVFEAVVSAEPLDLPWPRPSDEAGPSESSVAVASTGPSAEEAVREWAGVAAPEPPEAWVPESSPVEEAADLAAPSALPAPTAGAVSAESHPAPLEVGVEAEPAQPAKPPPLVDDLPLWGPPEVRFEPEVWTPGPTQSSTRTEHPTATYSTRPGMHRPPPGWHRPDLTEPPRSR